MDPLAWLHNQLDENGNDSLAEMVREFAQRLMAADVHAPGQQILALGELADDLLRRVPSSRHDGPFVPAYDDAGDQTTQPLDNYEGLTSHLSVMLAGRRGVN